ncbi:MAG: hypothetical protein AAB474_03010 [Patescibacteria group bacterium]
MIQNQAMNDMIMIFVFLLILLTVAILIMAFAFWFNKQANGPLFQKEEDKPPRPAWPANEIDKIPGGVK